MRLSTHTYIAAPTQNNMLCELQRSIESPLLHVGARNDHPTAILIALVVRLRPAGTERHMRTASAYMCGQQVWPRNTAPFTIARKLVTDGGH